MRHPDPSLLERYFNNQCTPEEVEVVLNWLATPEGQTYYGKVLEDKWKQLEEDPSSMAAMPIDDEKILKSIYQTSERMEQNSPEVGNRNKYRLKARYWHKIAAVFLGLLILSATYYYFQQPASIVHTTAFGETRHITLPDGSSVVMNANTRLSYDAGWQADASSLPPAGREVWVEGEAFFSVTPQPASGKFVVHARDVNVEVVGTEFNVSDRRGKTEVVLNTGKVKLTVPALGEGEILMHPDELVSYSQKEKKVSKKIINAARYTSWRHDLLIFEDTPLQEIARLMEDNYGWEVKVTDPAILDMRFNAEVPARDVDMLFTLLEKSFNITITKKNNVVFIQAAAH